PDQTTPEEIEQRLFAIQTIEAQHATREGIIEDAGMADLASVLGWSYPAGRGGVLNYPEFIGGEKFTQIQLRLQERFGSRFRSPEC
ncbi:MAG: 3-hydroxyacyl-CoA dehydrogenase / enoyl-CoA hydratase / 3-hydroxybutyryl-CoA epimerase, partial [Verrucomicrobiota bacterium]